MPPLQTTVIFKVVGAEGPPPKSLEISAHKATSDLVFPATEIAKARRLLLSDGENFGAKKMYQLKSTIEDWYAIHCSPADIRPRLR